MVHEVLRPIPGDGILARRGELALLCDGQPRYERQIAALLELVTEVAAQGGDGRRLGKRLAALLVGAEDDSQEYPALCLVGPLDGGLAVLVHGSAVVDVVTAGNTVRLDGNEAVTWVDRRFPAPVDGLRAALGGAAPTTAPDQWSRLDGGVMRAGGMVLGLTGASRRELGGGGYAEPASQYEEPLGGADVSSFVDRADNAVSAMAARAGAPRPGGSRISAAAAGLSAVGLSGPSKVEEEAETYEATAVNGIPAPAPREPQDDDVTAVNDDSGYEFGRRQSRLTLLRRRNSEPVAAEDTDSDLVTGAYCDDGHFNSPSAGQCRTCGVGLPQPPRSTSTGPRPPLGVLAVDGGPRLVVDGAFIVGRDPLADDDVAAGRAQPLRITDLDGRIAGVHARVDVKGWDVRVTDLGTPGGTHVCPPGGTEWSRVMPNVPTPIVPGSKVLFGRTGVRFEAYRSA